MPPVPTPIRMIAAPPSSSTGVGGPSSPSSKLDAATVLASVLSAGCSVRSSLDGSTASVSGASPDVPCASPLPSVGPRPVGRLVAAAVGRLLIRLLGRRDAGRVARVVLGVQLRAPRGLGGADDARRLAVLLEIGVDLREREVVAAQRVLAGDRSLLGRLAEDLVAAVRRREGGQYEQRRADGSGAQEAVSSPHRASLAREHLDVTRSRDVRDVGEVEEETVLDDTRDRADGRREPPRDRRSGRSGSRGCGCPRRS